jgi:hypothetical protein
MPYMKATFFFFGIFPPPPACPEILSRVDGPGARGATDAYKALLMEGIIRDVVFIDVRLYLLRSPVQ